MTMWPEGPAGPRSGSEWADVVRARLFEQRTILLRGELTDIAASEAGAELMTLDALGDTRVTDAGLKHVKEVKSLHRLDLRMTQVTDAGLKELKECRGLQRLILFETLVTDAGLRELETARPDLRISH